MPYEVIWESPSGFYARVTGWVTPELAARLAHEFTSDPRYDGLRYAIVDLSAAQGHTFRRDDRGSMPEAMVQLVGAGFSNRAILEVAIASDPKMLNFLETYARLTSRPFKVFQTLPEARDWLAGQSYVLRGPAGRPPRPG
jgi:hypothetical protein